MNIFANENMLRVGFLISFIFALTFVNVACGGVLDSPANMVRPVGTASTVTMVEDVDNPGWVVITNGSTESIFLSFERISQDSNNAFIPFNLVCYSDSAGYFNATPDRHSHPAITELKKENFLRFQIESSVGANSNCTVGVRYFDNENAVELLKRVFAEPTFLGFSKDEQGTIDRSTKDITLAIGRSRIKSEDGVRQRYIKKVSTISKLIP